MRAETPSLIRRDSGLDRVRLAGRGGCLLLLVAMAAGVATAQSVADVAKKSKEQSKDKKARIVITDRQLKSTKASPPAVGETAAGSTSATGGSGSATDDAAAPDSGQPGTFPVPPSKQRYTPPGPSEHERNQQAINERYREEFLKLYVRMAKAVNAYISAEQSADGYRMQAAYEEILKIQGEYQAMRERARKAGVPPGVFRKAERDLWKEVDRLKRNR